MKKKMNFGEIAEEWLKIKEGEVRESTLATYKVILKKHILGEFGQKRQIKEGMVQQFVNRKLTEGVLSLKSLQDILRIFKMVIKFGIKSGIKDLENFDIKIPKKYQKNSKKLQILSKKDYQTLNLYLNSNFSFKNLGIKLALNTGMRIGEICALRWCDIDERLGVIRVSKTLQRVYFLEEGRSWTEVVLGKPKTCGSFREIPLNKDLINIFKTIKKIVRAECFILTNDIKPMEPRTFRSYFSRLVASLGVNSVNFHALRHSFATRCIECGGDYKTVSAILGHSNINTTLNLYVHPDLEQKRKCIVQMNKFLGI